MAEVIRMPLLSDTMKEGVIAAWHKKVGDPVKSDDVLAEVETDKATMEVVGYVEGTLLYIGVEKGKAAQVNDIIAIIGKPGEDYQSLLGSNKQVSPAPEKPPIPASKNPTAPEQASLDASMKNVTVVRMPLLSDTMKEGKIIDWHKKIGDLVQSDDVLAEVETDKATMEVVGYAEGTLLYTGVEKGNAARVNDIIAIIGKPGTDIQPILKAEAAGPGPSGGSAPAAPAMTPSSHPAVAEAPASSSSQTPEGRIKVSPLAKKLAAEKGVNLSQVQGSGDEGRIIKRDIDQFVPHPPSSASGMSTAASLVPAVAGQEGFTDFPLNQMRKVIA
ncbi:MAG: biotin/lipoyl-containing protein, partial [Chitinophagaceae bacterium]